MDGGGIRSVGDLVERAYTACRPLSAHLELTYRCNLLCSFCYNVPQRRAALDGDQWILALDRLAAAGTFHVTLTGGEPFLHKDFFRIAGAVRERGLVLKTYTNGVALADRVVAERYAALAPFVTEISLHGATAATHDRLTGVRGSFDRLLTALGHLAELGVHVTLKTPITRLNQRELPEIDALGARFGWRVTYDANITPTDDGDLSPLSLSADPAFLVAFFARLAREGRQGLGPRPLATMAQNCGTGRVTLTIDPYGDIFPCVAWRRTIGNILAIEDLGALWQGRDGTLNETLAHVRRIADDVHRVTLAAAPEGAFASFCPAVAEKETGNAYDFYGGARLSGQTRLAAYRQVASEREQTSSGETVAPTECAP